MTVYVCFDKDIECGDRPQNWCLGCPKRGLLQVAVAPHAAAGPYPTAMRPATAEEAAAMARRFRAPLSDSQRADLLRAARYLASNNDADGEMPAAEADRIAAVLRSIAMDRTGPDGKPEDRNG